MTWLRRVQSALIFCIPLAAHGQVATPKLLTLQVPAVTTGGATPYHVASAATTNSTLISTGAHTLYSLVLINTTATIYYLRVYDQAAAPTCSSATGAVHSYPIPANTTGSGMVIPFGTVGEAYASGFGFCITGGGSDTDNTAAAAGVYVNASYK